MWLECRTEGWGLQNPGDLDRGWGQQGQGSLTEKPELYLGGRGDPSPSALKPSHCVLWEDCCGCSCLASHCNPPAPSPRWHSHIPPPPPPTCLAGHSCTPPAPGSRVTKADLPGGSLWEEPEELSAGALPA